MKKILLSLMMVLFLGVCCVGCATNDTPSQPTACEHLYTDTIFQPTCVNQGYTKHVCSKCSKSYIDSYVDALGHNYVETAATFKCTRCEHYEDDGFTFELINGNAEYQIKSVSKSVVVNGKVTTPRKHLGLPVTKLYRGCLYNVRDAIKTLEITSNIKYVGSSLFTYDGQYYRDNVTHTVEKVIFNTNCSDINISHTAFNFCVKLSSVTFPSGCFTKWNNDDMVGNHYLFEGTPYFNNKAVNIGGLYYIDNMLLKSDSATLGSEVNIKDGTKIIGNQVFKDNTNIRKLILPQSVTFIGSSAFANCLNLKNITYKGSKGAFNSIELGSNAFQNVTGVTYEYQQ